MTHVLQRHMIMTLSNYKRKQLLNLEAFNQAHFLSTYMYRTYIHVHNGAVFVA